MNTLRESILFTESNTFQEGGAERLDDIARWERWMIQNPNEERRWQLRIQPLINQGRMDELQQLAREEAYRWAQTNPVSIAERNHDYLYGTQNPEVRQIHELAMQQGLLGHMAMGRVPTIAPAPNTMSIAEAHRYRHLLRPNPEEARLQMPIYREAPAPIYAVASNNGDGPNGPVRTVVTSAPPPPPPPPAEPIIFFEGQDNVASCGRNAVNNMLQYAAYDITSTTPIDLNNPRYPMNLKELCRELTRQYRVNDVFECQDSENYTYNTLKAALHLHGLILETIYSRDHIASFDYEKNSDRNDYYYLINLGASHWTSMRNIINFCYYFDGLHKIEQGGKPIGSTRSVIIDYILRLEPESIYVFKHNNQQNDPFMDLPKF
jgi:hypothetical protein